METTNEEQIQVVRSTECPSLSGKSDLTYEIGILGEVQYIRLIGNSAGGLFCKGWIAMADVQVLLAGSPNVTSKTLQPLYAGRSSNSPGFLIACIINEKMAAGKDTNDTHPTKSVPSVPPQKKSAKKVTAKKIQI